MIGLNGVVVISILYKLKRVDRALYNKITIRIMLYAYQPDSFSGQESSLKSSFYMHAL